MFSATSLRGIEYETATATPADLAAHLQDCLGQRLTAYICGLRDPKMVGRWIAARASPRDDAELRLRVAFQASRLVAEAYDGETAKGWFVTVKSSLGDAAPAQILREAQSPDALWRVVALAREFGGEALE